MLLASYVDGPHMCTVCVKSVWHTLLTHTVHMWGPSTYEASNIRAPLILSMWAVGTSSSCFRSSSCTGYRGTVHVRTAKRYGTVRAIDMWSEAKVGWNGSGELLPGVIVRAVGADFVSTIDSSST